MASNVSTGARVLVTGATGFVGAHVVDQFLKSGYVVIGTSRNAKKASNVEKYFKDKYGPDRFEIYEAGDIVKEGAFDEVVKDVEVVAHVATPIFWQVDDPINKVVVPAINGTLNVLNSAHKYGKNVKHFVFTSSMAAVINIELDPAHVIDEEDWNDAITEKVYKQREEGQEIDAIVAYFASKNESERAFWRFKEENKPSFAMTTILPSYCFGPILPPAANDDAVQAASTSRMLADYFSGKAQDTSLNPQPFSFYVHIADVGRAHVLATKNLDKANGERYIVSAGSFNFQEAVDIMRENYPDRQHIITNGEPGNYPKSTRTADGSKVTRHLGLQYTDFKTTVLDSVKGLENVYKL